MTLYVGLISGTSADAIDAALVDIEGEHIRLLSALAVPYPEPLQHQIRDAFQQTDLPAATVAKLDMDIGESFARAVGVLLDRAALGPQQIAAIGSHGQTLRHEPDIDNPYSLQLGNGEFIATHTGIPTVNDFRTADIAAGGQGAPLAPALHNALFRHPSIDRGILNLGGIANITLLPADTAGAVTGFDTGPANTLMDAWVRRWRGESFDTDGAWARSGTVSEPLLELLLADAYFDRPPPKSTGFEYFNLQWLQTRLEHLATRISEADVQATLLEFTVQSLVGACAKLQELYVCGGGVHNRALMARLVEALQPLPVYSSAELGLDPDWVEAVTFAWLAQRRLQGLPGNLPSVTGAREAVQLGVVHRPK